MVWIKNNWYKLVSIVILLDALGGHDYHYYQILRWIIMVVSVYLAYSYFSSDNKKFGWIFTTIAILFNPILPFFFEKDVWHLLDVVTAIIFLFSSFITDTKVKKLMSKIKRSHLVYDPDHKGLSIQDAIIIGGIQDTELGIFYEYFYLKELYSGYKFLCQKLCEVQGKVYDIIDIETKEGNHIPVYFDISEFYGKHYLKLGWWKRFLYRRLPLTMEALTAVKSMDRKILLIDDNKFTLNMYKIKLQKRGVEVETFLDTEGDIVKRVADVKPDLIALDIVIPNRDGLETAKILKADKRTRDIPIVFMTLQGRLKDIQDAKETGASGYLLTADVKPERMIEANKLITVDFKIKATAVPENIANFLISFF